MTNDPIADLLTRLRNAIQRSKKQILLPSSNKIEAIVKILKEEGYISDYKLSEKNTWDKSINIDLKYQDNGKPAITHIERVSKPGLRIYKSYKQMPKVLNGLGIAIYSTPKGFMTGKNAIQNQVGGEYICNIW